MSHNQTKFFSFSINGLPEGTFEVAALTGSDGLSKLYRFDIMLLSADHNVDQEKIINSPATLVVMNEEETIEFQGIVYMFELKEDIGAFACYKAVLMPGAVHLSDTMHNRIFLDKSIQQIIEEVLAAEDFTSLDYEFRLSGTYPPKEYVCQYDESSYDFIARRMEHEGMYFFFEQGPEREKLIIADNPFIHSPLPGKGELVFHQPSGLDMSESRELVYSFTSLRKALPNKITLKDYNYRVPSLDLSAEAVVSPTGKGNVYIYGEHFRTNEEGEHLARIRAEEFICRSFLFHGQSLSLHVRSGYRVNLQGHKREGFNRGYLVTDVHYEGYQNVYSVSGIARTPSGSEKEPFFRNSFTAIFDDVVFRPERNTLKPKFSGTINAFIDAEGDGQYAELDEQGRYKVRLPFDISNPSPGHASAWVRMAQPYAGSNHGMHFPLHKGAEVLLTFIDGDPDRPIISAAVPNDANPNVITSGNNPLSGILTAGGNRLVFNDKKGEEFVGMASPFHASRIALGSVEGPGKGCLNFTTKGGSNSCVAGEVTSLTLGGKTTITAGNQFSVNLGTTTTFNATIGTTFNVADNISFNAAGNTYSLGMANSKSYTFRPKASLAAIEEVNIYAGSDIATSAIMEGINLTLLLGLAANIALSGVASGLDANFDDCKGGLLDDTNWHWSTGMSIASAVTGLAFGVASHIVLKKAANAFDAAKKGGKITVNAQGVKVLAANVLKGDSNIQMQAANNISLEVPAPLVAGTPVIPPSSSQTMSKNKIELTTKSLVETDMSSVAITPTKTSISTNMGTQQCSLGVATNKLELTCKTSPETTQGSLTLNSTGASLVGPMPTAASLKITGTSLKMERADTSMEMTDTSFSIKRQAAQINMGATSMILKYGSGSQFIIYASGLCSVKSAQVIQLN